LVLQRPRKPEDAGGLTAAREEEEEEEEEEGTEVAGGAFGLGGVHGKQIS